MHDQVEALKWVQRFISGFGGNKDNVTIMGESAGAMACFLHYVSPLSKGLFHKVIALSGSASTPFLHNDREPRIYARGLAKSLGLNENDSPEKLVEQLQTFSGKELMKKTMLFKDWDNSSPLPWKPVIDAYARKPFMPKSFEESIKAGSFDNKIPILSGTMGEEGLIVTAPFYKSKKRWKIFFRQWEKWAPQLFFNRETELITENDVIAANRLLECVYPNINASKTTSGEDNNKHDEAKEFIEDEKAILMNQTSQNSNEYSIKREDDIPQFTDENIKKVEEIITTGWFHSPLVNDLERLINEGVTAYAFKFCYRGSFSIVDIFRLSTLKMGMNLGGRLVGLKLFKKKLGACHSDDLVYIFPMKLLPKPLSTELDVRISSILTSYITNFAKCGKPIPNQNDNPDNTTSAIQWTSLKSTNEDILVFDKDGNIAVTKDKDEERNKFWNGVTNQNPFSISHIPITSLYTKIAEFR